MADGVTAAGGVMPEAGGAARGAAGGGTSDGGTAAGGGTAGGAGAPAEGAQLRSSGLGSHVSFPRSSGISEPAQGARCSAMDRVLLWADRSSRAGRGPPVGARPLPPASIVSPRRSPRHRHPAPGPAAPGSTRSRTASGPVPNLVQSPHPAPVHVAPASSRMFEAKAMPHERYPALHRHLRHLHVVRHVSTVWTAP